ncbi:hypothetical protein LTR91_022407 [Friedmanniomyces endolithicus]|uniref:RRM domain-containing protein n=1 Tax=Friedmanniomyces endolithicus TaxID=329885 RepID=A0AAN6H595_9PEZI|nr:hypothetical protein LTR94_021771 [Friedmanniomyces endolithicus]KAK0789256.1 hypothetical protein LTR59_009685 [Friedmanniomyces endolithicus]KAK0826610.1 hypothetical protein LTR03_017104 [Friedmanniomyces endolithicus]KAK0841588.1 hypothetical protein LTS02_016798 [Friedmanniomyces endolithicus]KAK0861175.1 hypothetical protein LTR87_017050 [Friedmanniomyces endolithicus]
MSANHPKHRDGDNYIHLHPRRLPIDPTQLFVLRRLAVKAISQQPSRSLSTLQPRATRVTTLKPTLLRSFHQSRVYFAEQENKPEEASHVEAETSGETVTSEQPASAQDAVSESTGTTGGHSEPVENDSGPALNTSSYDANAMPSYTSTGATESHETQREPAQPQHSDNDSFASQAQDLATSAAQTAQSAAGSVSQAARAAYDSTVDRSTRQQRPRRDDYRENQNSGRPREEYSSESRSTDRARSDAPPSRICYIGNLFFEVTAPQLEAELSQFGAIANSRIVTDARGLSKGFGYVEFEDQNSADRAVREQDRKVFQGRRMAVQYHVRKERTDTSASREYRQEGSNAGSNFGRQSRAPTPPSKTLFIGNMSYQMSDRDLNDLFREISNVLDVRVAIDRRSGQPRGFAHADFVDVASAEKGKEVLETKVIYGRQLKIDFSSGSSGSVGRSMGESGGSDEGEQREQRY